MTMMMIVRKRKRGSGRNHEEQGDIKSAFISKFTDLERLNKGPQKDSDGVALPGGGEGWIILTIGWRIEDGHSHGPWSFKDI